MVLPTADEVQYKRQCAYLSHSNTSRHLNCECDKKHIEEIKIFYYFIAELIEMGSNKTHHLLA